MCGGMALHLAASKLSWSYFGVASVGAGDGPALIDVMLLYVQDDGSWLAFVVASHAISF